MVDPHVLARLGGPRRVLVAGCGGGYDVLGAVPIRHALAAAGIDVELASLSFAYLNGLTGVSHFSVWSFYAEHPEAPFPFRQPGRADFGTSKFGRASDAPQGYAGRRVELRGRSIDAVPGDDPVEALQRYLKAGATRSARELAAQAVVLIEPESALGAQVWPTLVLPSAR